MKKYLPKMTGLRGKAAWILAASLLIGTAAFAATAGETGSGGISPLMLMLLIFFGIIFFLQLIPAMVIFGSLVAAIFKRSKKATEETTLNEQV